MNYIVLSSSFFKENSKKEIKKAFPNTLLKELFEGNFLVKLDGNYKKLLNLGKKSIFINNLFPVTETIESSRLDSVIKKFYSSLHKKMNPKDTFRIETLTHGSAIHSRNLEVKLGEKLEKKGYKADLIKGDQIIFIVSFKNKHYCGLLHRKDLIYPYINVAKRFSREDSRLNRAQFKLIETIERFNINLSGGIAIDLGASPGGWSKVLSSRGYIVYAVDPANLDKSLKNNKNIKHIKKRVENFKPDFKADLITNDMNINPRESSEIIEKMSSILKTKGYVVLTLKLTKKEPDKILKDVSRILKSYRVVKVKHLFQNRKELTMLLQKRD